METFVKVIQDAERHLESAEKSSTELTRRIQEVSKACAVAEVDVEKSTAAIAASEKRLSILARQQSDTRKKLSALYRSLIAIPAVTNRSIGETATLSSAAANVVISSSSTAQDLAMFQCCIFNSLTSTANIETLVRHTHFVHAGLRHATGLNIPANPQPLAASAPLPDGDVEEKHSIDAMTPLCMYDLIGGCKNKHCCFQHLDGSDKKKNQTTKSFSSTSRSWQSLKLQQRLKISIGKSGARRLPVDTDADTAPSTTHIADTENNTDPATGSLSDCGDDDNDAAALSNSNNDANDDISECSDSADSSNHVDSNSISADGSSDVATATHDQTLSTTKRRYFHISSVDVDPSTDASSISAETPEMSSNDKRLVWGPDFSVVMAHCHDLWAACQVKAVCSCLYQCLHIDSGPDVDLLPFCVQRHAAGAAVPPELQEFVSESRSREEEAALWATLVHLLVTGDFVGLALLQLDEARGGACLDDGVFVVPPSRKHRWVIKFQKLLTHAPQFMQKIIFLLQRAHDVLGTTGEIEYVSNYLHIPVKFSVSCSNDDDTEGADTGKADTETSMAHRVVWLCTAVVTEVCSSAARVTARSAEKHAFSSGALLTKLYSETISAHRGRLVDTYPAEHHSDVIEIRPGSTALTTAQPKLTRNINFRFIASTLRLAFLSEDTISSMSLASSSVQDLRCFPGSIALALAANIYLSRGIEFEEFVVLFLKLLCDPSQAEETGAVFRCGGNKWSLSTAQPGWRGGSNCISSGGGGDGGEAACFITLLVKQHGREGFDSDDDAATSDRNSSSDSGDESNDGCTDRGSAATKTRPVLSKIEICHMLRELFVDIFSVHLEVHATPMQPLQLDVNIVVSLWLCVGKMCSLFEPPHSKSSSITNEYHAKTSIDNDKAIKRFFCNALVIHRNCTLGGVHSDTVVVDMSATILRMLFLFCNERIERLSLAVVAEAEAEAEASDGNDDSKRRSDHVDQCVCALLSLVVSVLVTVQHSVDSTASSRHNSNAIQITLSSILIKLKAKQLMNFRHAHHLLCVIQQGSHCGPTHHKQKRAEEWKGMSDLMGNLSEFYVLFPPQSFLVLRKCFSFLLFPDVFDLCFGLLNCEASTSPDHVSPFFLHDHNSAVERCCVKLSQCLNIRDFMTTTLQTLAPDALFQLAMVYFIAENFDALLIVQRVLLEMKHPCAMFNFARVFSVCFAAESLVAQAEVVREVCSMYNANASDDKIYTSSGAPDGANQWKRRRMGDDSAGIPRHETYLFEELPLLEQFSAESLVRLSGILTASTSGVPALQAQNSTTDLSNYSMHGNLPAALTVLADKESPSPIVNLNLSHNCLRHFPLVVVDITTLLRLDLSWNTLSSMPTGISSLAHLQVLDISHNEFTYFPSSVLKLSASLLELYLQDNKIEEIRNDFLKLARLEVLDVSNNRLRTVPSRLNDHMKLKFFRFSGNPVFDVVAAQQPKQSLLVKFSASGSARPKKPTSRSINHSKR